MNILQITNKFPFPANDGGSIAIKQLTEGFVAQGHKVILLAMTTYKHPANQEAIPRHLKNHITVYSVDIDTRIRVTDAIKNLAFSSIPYNVERFYSHQFKNRLLQILSDYTIDVVQLEGLYTAMYAPLIKQFTDVKVVMRAHNVEFKIWERRSAQEKNLFKKFYIKHLAKRLKNYETSLLSSFDAICPISDTDKKFFLEAGYKGPLKVVPCGIEPQHIQNTNNPVNHVSLCYIGALDWLPNQDGLLWFIEEVWEQLIQQDADWSLDIAGRNAPDWLIKKLRKPGINYYGKVENAQEFMKNHTVLLVPLFSGSGMRIKIIEAMALGKTVITTSLGAEGIYCNDQEHLFIADSAKDYFQTLNKISNQKHLIEQIGVNAHTFIKNHFDNFVISQKIIHFYKNLF